jgi:hypothetical protein
MTKQVTEDLEWKNIEHEVYRTYHFSSGNVLTIDDPDLIHISKSGGHRIVDGNGKSYYIAPKWDYFVFETDDDNAFRF